MYNVTGGYKSVFPQRGVADGQRRAPRDHKLQYAICNTAAGADELYNSDLCAGAPRTSAPRLSTDLCFAHTPAAGGYDTYTLCINSVTAIDIDNLRVRGGKAK